jgi:hypothetical protein
MGKLRFSIFPFSYFPICQRVAQIRASENPGA